MELPALGDVVNNKRLGKSPPHIEKVGEVASKISGPSSQYCKQLILKIYYWVRCALLGVKWLGRRPSLASRFQTPAPSSFRISGPESVRRWTALPPLLRQVARRPPPGPLPPFPPLQTGRSDRTPRPVPPLPLPLLSRFPPRYREGPRSRSPPLPLPPALKRTTNITF